MRYWISRIRKSTRTISKNTLGRINYRSQLSNASHLNNRLIYSCDSEIFGLQRTDALYRNNPGIDFF